MYSPPPCLLRLVDHEGLGIDEHHDLAALGQASGLLALLQCILRVERSPYQRRGARRLRDIRGGPRFRRAFRGDRGMSGRIPAVILGGTGYVAGDKSPKPTMIRTSMTLLLRL